MHELLIVLVVLGCIVAVSIVVIVIGVVAIGFMARAALKRDGKTGL